MNTNNTFSRAWPLLLGWLLGLLIALALGLGTRAGAASLSYTSASVDTTGKIVTVTIGGASGNLSMTANGFSVVSDTDTMPIASSSVSGSTTVTLTLSVAIRSASSGVTIAYNATTGNLTDTASDTLPALTATSTGVTNGSSASASFFSCTNPAYVELGGYAANTSVFSRTTRYAVYPFCTEEDLLWYGTDLSIAQYQYYSGSLSVTTDGGAAQTVSVPQIAVVANTTWCLFPLVSGQALGWHRTVINYPPGSSALAYVDQTNTLYVCGSGAAIEAPTSANTSIDPVDSVVPLNVNGVNNTNFVQPDANFAYTSSTCEYTTFYDDSAIRFQGNPAKIEFYGVCQGQKVRLAIDGSEANTQTVTLPSSVLRQRVVIATGLDTTRSHKYILSYVTAANGAGNGFTASSLITVGNGSIDMKDHMPILPLWSFMGDSRTVVANLTDSTYGYVHLLMLSQNIQTANRGISGSTVSSTNGSLPMQSRVGALVNVNGTVPVRIVNYGITNDIGTANVTSDNCPPATFQASYLNMLQQEVAACPSVPITCFSDTQRSDVFASGQQVWFDSAIQNAIAALGSANVAYLNVSSVGTTAQRTDYCHLSAAGHAALFALYQATFANTFRRSPGSREGSRSGQNQ